MEPRSPNWIQTFTGTAFFPLDPRPEEVFLEDIAHALSMQCRYTGHTNRFYSVAEHSVLTSRLVPRQYRLTALLHDASEAYLSDISRPVKSVLSDYKSIEARLEMVIAAKFGLVYPYPAEVKEADTNMLFAERNALFNEAPPFPWTDERVPPRVTIVGYGPAEAKNLFIARYMELIDAR